MRITAELLRAGVGGPALGQRLVGNIYGSPEGVCHFVELLRL
jgi:hypothetical protein